MTERASESDADFFKQRGFGLKIGFGERPALLVIDMLKAFTNPQMMLGANLDNEIEAIKPLIAVAHERDIPVIFSTVIYNDADLKDAGIWALKQKGVVTLKGDSDGVEIDPRLDFRKTDSLLVKKYASCFFGTDLVSRLLSRRVDTVIIVGCTTSGCVRATAVDAVQTGLRPMVVREAVGDRSAAAHDQSLFDLNAKYADVVSLEETSAVHAHRRPQFKRLGLKGRKPCRKRRRLRRSKTAIRIRRSWTASRCAGRMAHAWRFGSSPISSTSCSTGRPHPSPR